MMMMALHDVPFLGVAIHVTVAVRADRAKPGAAAMAVMRDADAATFVRMIMAMVVVLCQLERRREFTLGASERCSGSNSRYG